MADISGFMWTRQRKAVRAVLQRYKRPLAIEEVYARGNGAYDRATAFRTLKLFHHKGFVSECNTRADMKTYEWIATGDHHHHIVCLECEKTRDIHITEEPLLAQAVSASRGFATITGHTIEFFGICTSCSR